MNKKHLKKFAAAMALCMVVPVMCMTVEGCKKGDGDDSDIVQTVTVSSISLDTSACKTTFGFKEDFSVAGLKVTAHMSDNTTVDVPLSECQITSPDTSVPGTRVVRVTYKGKQESYQITINDRVMPPISEDPLFSIDIENPHTSFKVEMEDVDYEISGVTKADEELSLIGTSEDESVSGGKYLANYGVEGNYFGFAFNSNEQYEDVTIRFHVANPNTVVTGIGTNMNIYLNYNGYYEPNELDINDLTVLPAAKVVEPETPEEGEEGGEEVTPPAADPDAPVEVTYGWETRVVRGVTLEKGLNKLTFDVLGENVVYIDYIEFYVGVEYYTDNYTELDGEGVHVKEFEDFDLEKIIVRQDIKNAHQLADGQAFVETPTSNLENTSGGKSVGATMPGTEISTVLHVEEDATVQILFTAAATSKCVIADEIEMYVDGVKLTDVERKDIKNGNAGAGQYWNWVDNSFGVVNLEAGDHVLKILVVAGGTANFDCVKFNVLSWGEFTDEVPVNSDIVIDGHGSFAKEAEYMSFKEAVGSVTISDGWANSSEGSVITGFEAGSKFNVYLNSEEDSVVKVALRFGYNGNEESTIADNCKFYLDGTEVTLSAAAREYIMKTANEALVDVNVIEALNLTAGDHVLTIEL